MLERQALLIRPPDATGRRGIVDPESGAALGHAGRRRPRLLTVLEVREVEDEPLLFTARRWWLVGPIWAIRDADGNGVGFVGGTWVQNHWGRRVAGREPAGPGRTLFRGRQGQELAAIQDDKEGRRLLFSAELDGEPFVKMLLLAAALLG